MRLARGPRFGVVIFDDAAVSKLWGASSDGQKIAEHPNVVADKENTSDVKVYKAMRDAIDPAKMTVLCSLGDLPFA